jgi:hypothetical protein
MKRAIFVAVVVAMMALVSAPSLAASVSDYVKAGAPSPDRVWTGTDYQKFAALLKSGKIELPMLSDESKPIFLALVNREGLSFYSNKDVAIGVRMQGFMAVYASLPPVISQYLERYGSHKADCSKELDRLMAFTLYACTSETKLMQEFLPTIPKDEKYDTQMEGMKAGLRGMWVAGAECMADRKTLADDEVLVIAEAMIENFPAQREFIGPTTVLELHTKIAALLEKEKSDKVKSALQRLLNTFDLPAAK